MTTPDPPRRNPTTDGPAEAAISAMFMILSLLTCKLQVTIQRGG
jgi:hypothetical protein